MAMLKRSEAGKAPVTGWSLRKPSVYREAASTLPVSERESFYRTIRFRLTAWYAFILIVVVVSMSFAVSSSVRQGLEQDTDSRLGEAAVQIRSRTYSLAQTEGLALDPDNPSIAIDAQDPEKPLTEYFPRFPDTSDLVLSGIWVAYTERDGGRSFRTSTSTVDTVAASIESEEGMEIGSFPPELFAEVDTTTALTSGESTIETVSAGDQRARILVFPIFATREDTGDEEVIGSIVVGSSLQTQQTTMGLVNQILRIASIAGVGLAAWGGWIIAGRALAPVKKITGTVENITERANSAESLAIRLDVPHTGDEISHLATTFNRMLSRIEDSFKAQRRFVADASHELRTPLTAIRGNVDVLLRQAKSGTSVGNEVLVEALGDVHRESGRMARLIDDLLTLARSDARELVPTIHLTAVSLDVLASEAYRTLEPLAGDRFLVLNASTPVTVNGDGDRLVQVMIVLGENAIRHTPPGGTVTISVDQPVPEPGAPDCARVIVSDTGEGIAESHLPHLFERFYRAEGSRERGSGGTGLGLSIALGIVRSHGGWIDVETAPGRGSSFAVHLPL